MLSNLHKHLQDRKLLPKHSKILVAVSGGVDSVVLLDLINGLRAEYGWKLAVAHYNHGMRPDATQDAMLVGELADKYGIPYYMGKYEYTNFTEATLRKYRYEFLEEIRRDLAFDYIITAHHNNDFIETAIFNTIRGSDREGMVALKPRRGSIIRPLLPFSKAEIIVYAGLKGLKYREDSTNSDLGYSRNFVRNILIPHGSIAYRNFHHNMNRRLSSLTDINRKVNLGLGRVARTLVEYEDDKSLQISAQRFGQLPYSIQKSLLVFLVKRLRPVHGLSSVGVTKAVKFINTSKTGSQMSLPDGLQLINTYDKFVITSDKKDFSSEADDSLHIFRTDRPFHNKLFRLSISTKGSAGTKIPARKLYVRYRQAGDRVRPMGMSGSKKLQDVFVDAKVPRHLRAIWPVVVTASNEIVWVPNVVKDRRFFDVSTDNYQYLNCEVV